MIHLNTNYSFNRNNVSFGLNGFSPDFLSCYCNNNPPEDYTNAVGNTVFHKGTKTKVANDAVIELGVKGSNKNHILCMDDEYIQSLRDGEYPVGREGFIQVPDTYDNISAKHLFLIKKEGDLFIADVSDTQTILSSYENYTNKETDTPLPKGKPVVLEQYSVLRLANSTRVDFESPEIKEQLDKLEECKVYTLGTEGDIKITTNDPKVSSKHLKIMKTSGKIIVTDISENGTYIKKGPYTSSPYYATTNKPAFYRWLDRESSKENRTQP